MNKTISTNLNTSDKRLVRAMQILGDETRFKIFKLLLGNHDLCVSQIATELNVSPSAISQHFRNFEMVGLVSKTRRGQKICYVLNDDDFVSDIAKLTNQ